MLVITSLGFQGTSITPQYANLSVVGGKIVLENLGSFGVDDLVNNDLTGIVNSITGGGTISGRAGEATIGTGNSFVAVTFSTPLPSVNYAVTITVTGVISATFQLYSSTKTINGFNLNCTITAGSPIICDWIAISFV